MRPGLDSAADDVSGGNETYDTTLAARMLLPAPQPHTHNPPLIKPCHFALQAYVERQDRTVRWRLVCV